MAIEVELKAWVDDAEGLRARVAARYPHGGSYVKEDVYYRLPRPGAEGGPAGSQDAANWRRLGGPDAIEFRLRIEGGQSIVTAKRKSLIDGVEVNDEIEYGVSDAAAFERFAEYLGAAVFARKRKSGERFRAGEITIELSHVDRLGDFVEIERLVEGEPPGVPGAHTPSGARNAADRVAAAQAEVRRLLGELGIPASKIEPRYYIDMLADLES